MFLTIEKEEVQAPFDQILATVVSPDPLLWTP